MYSLGDGSRGSLNLTGGETKIQEEGAYPRLSDSLEPGSSAPALGRGLPNTLWD